jgi:hypothetical protein
MFWTPAFAGETLQETFYETVIIGLPSIEINCEIHHFGLPSFDHRYLLLTFKGCPLT